MIKLYKQWNVSLVVNGKKVKQGLETGVNATFDSVKKELKERYLRYDGSKITKIKLIDSRIV